MVERHEAGRGTEEKGVDTGEDDTGEAELRRYAMAWCSDPPMCLCAASLPRLCQPPRIRLASSPSSIHL